MFKTRPKTQKTSTSSVAQDAADDHLQDPLTSSASPAAAAAGGQAGASPGRSKRGAVGKLKSMLGLGKKKGGGIADPNAVAQAGKVLDAMWSVQGQVDNFRTRVPQAIKEIHGLWQGSAAPPIIGKLEYILVLSEEASTAIAGVSDAFDALQAGGSPARFKGVVLAAVASLSELRSAIAGSDGGEDGLTIGEDGILMDPFKDSVGGQQVMSEGAYGALKAGKDNRKGAKGQTNGSGQLAMGGAIAQQSLRTYGPALLKCYDVMMVQVKGLA